LSIYALPAHTRHPQPVFYRCLVTQRLWHGASGGATFASQPKRATGAAKARNNKQLINVFMQALDSKDKIATRL
jgi:hypothetical protein